MSAIVQTMTADDLLAMKRDGYRYDLVKGELRRMSLAGGEHGILIARFTAALVNTVDADNLGIVFGAETGFKLASDPDTVLGPDVAFIARDRVPKGKFSAKYWDVVPDLVVEVVSPSDRYTEVDEKVAEYLAAGVRVVIVLNPRRKSAAVHRGDLTVRIFQENETLLCEDVVPGFKLDLAKLFASEQE
jgi:Uma2 family endonuclease